jgi:hypothetical protein
MYREVGHVFIYMSGRDLSQCSTERDVVSNVHTCVYEDLA